MVGYTLFEYRHCLIHLVIMYFTDSMKYNCSMYISNKYNVIFMLNQNTHHKNLHKLLHS